ncbi:ornithine cyclodeaminase family protein [Rhodoligotrophos defluvii]|uniref:ornithine cyclodeaminase family protein n=1 Tax=Rhodoligotrophos defluvii TaxID=2561934 RepID=UPI0010C96C74|nr:ornithine cyclodeaminase family protein [Rhodoligotrophos defluvii]
MKTTCCEPGSNADAPIFLSEAEAAKRLTPALLLETVETTLRQLAAERATVATPSMIAVEDARGRRAFKAMPGALPEQNVAGVKWVGTFDRNAQAGLPRAPATVVLTDFTNGTLLGIVEATGLTAWRTAAMATVAARHAGLASPARIAVLGFGAIGKALAALLAHGFPQAEIRVWSRDQRKTDADAQALLEETGIRVTPAARVEQAVDRASIIVTATGLSADAPFLSRSMVKTPAFICGLGSYQELADDLILAADTLIVDDWQAATKRGNLAPLIKAGRLTPERLDASLAEWVAGKLAGRAHPHLTVASFTGLGVLDVAMAAKLLGR